MSMQIGKAKQGNQVQVPTTAVLERREADKAAAGAVLLVPIMCGKWQLNKSRGRGERSWSRQVQERRMNGHGNLIT